MTRADWIILLCAVALLPTLYVRYWGSNETGMAVHIAISGQPEQTLSLAENKRVVIHGPLGDSVLEIKDGRVRFLSSPCHGQQCVHTGWLAHAGELAACLPNGIIADIVGNGPRYDSINF